MRVPEQTLKDRFLEFHAQHPDVLDLLVRLAYEAKAAGATKIGMKALYERARWEYNVGPLKRDGGPRLNNDWPAFYVRLIVRDYPDLAGMFELRRQRGSTIHTQPQVAIDESTGQVRWTA